MAEVLSKHLGFRIRGVKVRESQKYPGQDYYGIIREGELANLSTFIVEHGHHDQFAADIQGNIEKCLKAYEEIFMNISSIEGVNRYETCAKLSEMTFPNGANTILIASGENFPDALCAGELADQLNAPILITPKDSLNGFIEAEIIRLNPDNCIRIGGKNAVSDEVMREIGKL
jgi:putative cell wall-binding protein